MLNKILEDIWDLRDKRMDSYPLMNSPLPTAALCCLYFYCVKFLGPKLMSGRKPFEIKGIIIWYNLIQVRKKIRIHTYHATYGSSTTLSLTSRSCSARGSSTRSRWAAG